MKEIETALEQLMFRAKAGVLSSEENQIILDLLNCKIKSRPLEVKTPLGEIIAYRSTDDANPGIYVDFRPKDTSYARSVALTEYESDNKAIRHVAWGQKGNISDNDGYTACSTIYAEDDLALAGCRLTDDAKELVVAITEGNPNVVIVGGENGYAVIRDTVTGKGYRVDIQEIE